MYKLLPLKSVYLLPHGGVIVPGMEENRSERANLLHEKMTEIGTEIENEKIDLIIMTSPHGYSHPNDYLFYFHDIFEGWHFYSLKEKQKKVEQLIWRGNSSIAQVFLQSFQQTGLPANPIILGDISYPLKLAWGETIPLSYIASSDGPQVIPFSIPLRVAYQEQDSENIWNELKGVGQLISMICEIELLKDTNISLIISGDLSHKHDKNSKYGFHETSSEFDKKAEMWANELDEALFIELLDLQKTAESCGIYGMGIIQGVFEQLKDSMIHRWSQYSRPTYFGMLISSWKIKN